jgi:hypothetical protein
MLVDHLSKECGAYRRSGGKITWSVITDGERHIATGELHCGQHRPAALKCPRSPRNPRQCRARTHGLDRLSAFYGRDRDRSEDATRGLASRRAGDGGRCTSLRQGPWSQDR